MTLKRNRILGAVLCLTIGCLSGCGSDKNETNLLDPREQTIVSSQTDEALFTDNNMESHSDAEPVVIIADYTEAFESIQGCAVVFDAVNNTYTFYNEDQCKNRVSPNSTFKVISTLVGLHNQVIMAEDSKMEYDGTIYPMDTWNADLSLKEAFQSSCIWYFRKIIDQAGQEIVQEELNSLAYGNCDISEWGGSGVNPFPELNGFWLESSLMISPVEQVDILRNIVEGKTIYTEAEVEILKSIMLVEMDDSKKIYGKTGTGTDGTAWFIGFVEYKDANIYFAIYLDDEYSNEINGSKAKEIAFKILEVKQ